MYALYVNTTPFKVKTQALQTLVFMVDAGTEGWFYIGTQKCFVERYTTVISSECGIRIWGLWHIFAILCLYILCHLPCFNM